MSKPALPEISDADYAKYEEAAAGCLARVKEVIDSADWKKDKEEPDVTFYSRSAPGSKFLMIKAVSLIPKPYDVVVNHLCGMDDIEPSMPADKRDGTHQRHLFVKEANKWNDGFLYMALETTSRLVSPRDFLMYRKHFAEDGKDYFSQVSIVNDAIKPEVKGFVRAQILTQCFVIEQAGDNVKLTFIVHADPAGSVPAMIYNTIACNQGNCVKKIKLELTK